MVISPKVLRIEPASKYNLGYLHYPTGTIEMETGVMSLDGYSSEDSEKIRKKNNANKIVENLKKILAKKKKLKSNLKIQICNIQFITNKNNSILSNTPDWILEIFKNEDITYKNFFVIQCLSMHEKDLNEFDKILIDQDDKNYCDHVVNTIMIRSDGTIVLCCYDLKTQLHMGNIMNDSLKKIWNNSDYTKLCDSIKSKEYISICKNCNVARSPVYLVPKKNLF